MLDNKIPVIDKEFLVEKFDNEILLYTTADSKAIYLNETAHIVWQLCNQSLSVGDMIAALVEQYPEQKDQIRSDVVSSLESLVDSGAISFADE